MDYNYEILQQKIRSAQNLMNSLIYKYDKKTEKVIHFDITHIPKVYNILKDVDIFKSEMRDVERVIRKNQLIDSTGIYAELSDQPKINANIIIKKLSEKINIIEEFLSNTLTTKKIENTIQIKIPNNVSDFEDLSNISDKLQLILSQTILHDNIGGKIEIKNVKNGSIWFDVALGTAKAIVLIGSMAWAAAVIYKKILEGRIMHEQLRLMAVKTETIKDIKNAQKTSLGQLIALETKHIIDENYTTADPEQIERVKNSIRLLADIMEKGTEIHPAINTPENVANLFPNPSNILSVASRVKELGSGDNKIA